MVRMVVIGVLLALGLVAPTQHFWTGVAGAQEATPEACAVTTPADNEAVARRWFEEALNNGDLTVLDEILADNLVYHTAGGGELTAAEAGERVLNPILTGFPDVHYTVVEAFTGEDIVVLIWRAEGTQTGEFQGHAPTGKPAVWTGINVYRFECGLVAEAWAESDALGRLRQLGLIGTPVP